MCTCVHVYLKAAQHTSVLDVSAVIAAAFDDTRVVAVFCSPLKMKKKIMYVFSLSLCNDICILDFLFFNNNLMFKAEIAVCATSTSKAANRHNSGDLNISGIIIRYVVAFLFIHSNESCTASAGTIQLLVSLVY